jgi:gliding motility-associated-like protein
MSTKNILKNKILNFLLCTAVSVTASAQVPLANFTASPLSGCSPLVVTFQDLSTNAPTSWLWDFGNGATSLDKNPTTSYFTPGTYSVKLTVTNASGSHTLVRNDYITVAEFPTVNFSADKTTGCFPLDVQFTDNSSAGTGNTITSWEWNFGDGATSTLQSPGHRYTSSGNYSVTLKVTNDKGCVKILSKPSYISVSPGVVANFSTTIPSVCNPPVNVSFNNTSTGPGVLSFAWNFGDGGISTQQHPAHTYNSAGSFNVSLTVSSSIGCSATVVKNNEVVIGGSSTSFTAPDSALTNIPITFTNTSGSSPTSQTWNFGDGTSSSAVNPVKTYSVPGTYFVTLTNNYGACSFTFSKIIVITPKSITRFTASDSLSCKPPLLVNFQNTTPGSVSWLWYFGDGDSSSVENPSHTYTSYGSYDVTLITTNSAGKKDTLVKTAFINIKKTEISVTGVPSQGGCLPLSVSPVATINAVGTVTSYLWNFGDGFISGLQNPSHTYTLQGTYNISLIVSTSLGCTDTLNLSTPVKTGTIPTADFSATPLTTCVFTPVQFTDLSSSSVNEWIWDFGDSFTSSDKNPLHEFAKPGNYTITLTAKNNGCAAKLIKPAYINVLPPLATFTATPNCTSRTEFTFTDQSESPATWQWDFGDGTNSSLQNPPPHNFPGLGTYIVSLIVTNGSCADTTTQVIKAINENPDFTSNITTLCRGHDVNFTATSITAANIKSYLWDFGDGNQVSTPDISTLHTYAASGTTTVMLITTDLNNCTDTIIKPTYIRTNGPVANFDASNTGGCSGLTTTFNDLSVSDGVNPLVSWKWNFGDSSIQTFNAAPFTHTYNKVGTFPVTLYVTDAAGCTDSLTIADLIHSTDPTITFSSPDTLSCPGANINWSVNATGSGIIYAWDFGDGTTASASIPPKSYLTNGVYTVKLSVTDQYGCKDSLVKPNYIRINQPQASFSVNDTASFCLPFEVKFTNTSAYYTAQVWTFEPGVTSVLQSPAHYYTFPGLYNAELIVTSPGGCTDTAYQTILLYDTAGSQITYNPLYGCKPQTVSFNSVINGPATFIWDFGDGQTVVSPMPNIAHHYNQFGKFVPKIILQDPTTGCLTPIIGADTIRIVGATANFGLDKTFLCNGDQVNFIDSTTFNDPVISYSWNFGDGTTSSSQHPSHLYSGAGYYNVLLAVQTAQGCVDTLRRDSILKIVTGPAVRMDGDSAACVFAPLQFLGRLAVPDTSAITWSWNFGNGVQSVLQNPPSQTFNAPGNYVATLKATNSSGCRDSVSKNIRIHPLPTVSLPKDTSVIAGSSITIPAIYSGTMVNYNWSPSAFLNCTNCAQPVVTPETNTRYTVVFSDSNNCRNSGTILIKALCQSSNLFVPNTFSPNADGSNDVFYPRGIGIDKVRFLRIFNRWGEVVFERYDMPVNNPLFGWDGTRKGKNANADVYIYQLEAYCQSGEMITLTGNITLIR